MREDSLLVHDVVNLHRYRLCGAMRSEKDVGENGDDSQGSITIFFFRKYIFRK